MGLWNKAKENSAATGGEFEEAAARVTAEDTVTRGPDAVAEVAAQESEALEIRPEWAEWAARAPFAVVAGFYHPAFALSDEQAEALGPKLMPLMEKISREWIPSWLASTSNRNPEIFDAVAAIAVTGFVQWQYVAKIKAMEAAARAAAARVERGSDAPPDAVPVEEAHESRLANTGGGIRVI